MKTMKKRTNNITLGLTVVTTAVRMTNNFENLPVTYAISTSAIFYLFGFYMKKIFSLPLHNNHIIIQNHFCLVKWFTIIHV